MRGRGGFRLEVYPLEDTTTHALRRLPRHVSGDRRQPVAEVHKPFEMGLGDPSPPPSLSTPSLSTTIPSSSLSWQRLEEEAAGGGGGPSLLGGMIRKLAGRDEQVTCASTTHTHTGGGSKSDLSAQRLDLGAGSGIRSAPRI